MTEQISCVSSGIESTISENTLRFFYSIFGEGFIWIFPISLISVSMILWYFFGNKLLPLFKKVAYLTLISYIVTGIALISPFSEFGCSLTTDFVPILEYTSRTFMFCMSCIVLVRGIKIFRDAGDHRLRLDRAYSSHWSSKLFPEDFEGESNVKIYNSDDYASMDPNMSINSKPEYDSSFVEITRKFKRKYAFIAFLNLVLGMYILVSYLFRLHEFEFIELQVEVLGLSMPFESLVDFIIDTELYYEKIIFNLPQIGEYGSLVVNIIRAVILFIFMLSLRLVK